MLIKQKQQIDSYQRVQDFLRAHAPPESPGYVVQKKKFDDIVATLTDHSSGQVEGRRMRHAEITRQRLLRKALREQHLSPIAQIARAELADAPGIDKALRMPSFNLNPLRLLADAGAMRTAAAPYEAQFVEAGRPADFLAQLDAGDGGGSTVRARQGPQPRPSGRVARRTPEGDPAGSPIGGRARHDRQGRVPRRSERAGGVAECETRSWGRGRGGCAERGRR